MNDIALVLIIAVIVLAIWNVYLTLRLEITHHIIAEIDYLMENLNKAMDRMEGKTND